MGLLTEAELENMMEFLAILIGVGGWSYLIYWVTHRWNRRVK